MKKNKKKKKKTLSQFSLFETLIFYPGSESAKTADCLVSGGVKRENIVFVESFGKPSLAFYSRSKKLCRKIEKKVKRELGKGFRVKIQLLERNDWYDKWQLDYQVMNLGNRFVLVPDWQKKDYTHKGKRIPIILDPMGASGSGEHPSTQIMADFLEKIEGKFKTCLDLGTGTGILAVMAGKMGAEDILALDNDRMSVKAAKFNLEENQISGARVIYADVLKKPLTQKYDLVCANLISPVLEKIKKVLFGAVKPGGYLAVSGIHKQNFPGFSPKFRHTSFRCLKKIQKRGWTGMLFKRI